MKHSCGWYTWCPPPRMWQSKPGCAAGRWPHRVHLWWCHADHCSEYLCVRSTLVTREVKCSWWIYTQPRYFWNCSASIWFRPSHQLTVCNSQDITGHHASNVELQLVKEAKVGLATATLSLLEAGRSTKNCGMVLQKLPAMVTHSSSS